MKKFETKECSCGGDNVKLYIAWKFDHVTKITDILAICRTKEIAEKYASSYKKNDLYLTSTWVDETITDHLLGSTMFGKRR